MDLASSSPTIDRDSKLIDPAAADPSWRQLPRRVKRAESEVAFGFESGFRVDLLARSHTFNPRDTYICPEDREKLAAILKTMSELAVPCRQLRYEASNREFEQFVVDGRAKVLDIPVRRGMIDFAEAKRAGADMVSVRNGVVLGVMRTDLPETRQILAIENAMKLDMLAGISLWFKAIGALSDEERNTLLANAATALHQ